MTWLNGALLAGFALVAIPIVIHLSMRRKPKRLVFPALQFVRARQETNRRRLRLRRWILLALRCLVLAAFVGLLARPTVAAPLVGDWILVTVLGGLALAGTLLLLAVLAARKGPLVWVPLALADFGLATTAVWLLLSVWTYGSDFPVGDARSPVSAIIVCDNSPRSGYEIDNQPLLGRAQIAAKRLVRNLPADSQVAVLGLERGTAFWSGGRSAATRSIDRLEVLKHPRSLLDALRNALRLAEKGRHRRREIYVFSDLTQRSWPDAEFPLKERLAADRSVSLFVLDVGVSEATNATIGDVELSRQLVAGAGAVEIDVAIFGTKQMTRTIELWLEDRDPSLPFMRDGRRVQPPSKLKDRARLTVGPDQPARHRFSLLSLEPGTHHGEIRMVESDPLSIDNRRYFTLVVRRPWRMLVCAGPHTSLPAWVEAVAPREMRERKEASFEIEIVPPKDLAQADLTRIDVVCLLDPPPLDDAVWKRLQSWVSAGKGLCVALGPNAGTADAFATEGARRVLGCAPSVVFRAKDTFLAPTSYEHPVLRAFRPFADSVPWTQFVVRRHWGIEVDASTCAPILPFANGEPALLEHRLGSGRVLIATTPLTEVDRPPGRPSWNDLAGPNDWPRFILVNELAAYAAGAHEESFNYFTGQTAVLRNAAGEFPSAYQLSRPRGPLQIVRSAKNQLRIAALQEPGHYRLKGMQDPTFLRGFSANLVAAETDLQRVDVARLDQLLGENRYQLARNIDELERQQGTQRSGREFYPYLVIILVALLIAEQVFADRFYERREEGASRTSLSLANHEA